MINFITDISIAKIADFPIPGYVGCKDWAANFLSFGLDPRIIEKGC
jgi:hypothetical protein